MELSQLIVLTINQKWHIEHGQLQTITAKDVTSFYKKVTLKLLSEWICALQNVGMPENMITSIFAFIFIHRHSFYILFCV